MNRAIRSFLITIVGIVVLLALLYGLLLLTPFLAVHAFVFGSVLSFCLIWALVYICLYELDHMHDYP